MEKYIGTYHKSSPFIQNLLKKQICSFEILWQNYPPSMQIFSNLPLDSYLHVLAEILPPFADFLKSATGQLPKLPTCACRNSPPFADFLKSTTGQLPKLPTCACRIPPTHLQIFQKSATLCRFTEICMQKFPPICVKGIVGTSAIVISTTPWTQHISFALGNSNLFQQTR